jgi:hypothetical protein
VYDRGIRAIALVDFGHAVEKGGACFFFREEEIGVSFCRHPAGFVPFDPEPWSTKKYGSWKMLHGAFHSAARGDPESADSRRSRPGEGRVI